jgi:indolepyruvate decarboxylase
MARPETTVAGYLLHRLKEIGIHHLFGVPGDFVLGFLNQVLESDVAYVGTCNELNAAYAADGYARIKGAGAFVSTFGVGELSALNGVAGAFAERVPVVVITGAPATTDFASRPLLHHTLGDYDIPFRMFEAVTVAQAKLESGDTAPAEIDRVLTACLALQQPVYLRLPSDVVAMACPWPLPFSFDFHGPSDPGALAEAVAEASARLGGARRPLVIAGVDLNRLGYQSDFATLLEKTGFPYATMMLGKAVLSERHPQFMGVYEGARSREAVRRQVEAADMVLQLGHWMTDFNTGGFTTRSDLDSEITADLRSVKIGHHVYEDVNLPDFLKALTLSLVRKDPSAPILNASEACLHRRTKPFLPQPTAPLTVARLFDRMSHFLEPGAVVLAETGVSLFSAAEMLLPDGATFIGQTFYGSIGYTVGATLGACLAAPGRQVVLFIGDGAFQVTGQDLSTLIRHDLKPVIVLLNNDGYTIERVICDRSYNDLQPWSYHKLSEVFGGPPGWEVSTEGDLEQALEASASTPGLVFLEVRTGRGDCPEALRSAGRSMALDNHLEVTP